MSVETQTEALADGIILTEVAAKKVSDLAASEGEEGLALRISVAHGGCSGLRYQLALDDRELDGREHDALDHREVAEEVEALEDHAHVLADGWEVATGTGDVGAQQDAVARRRCLQPVHAAQER